MNNISEADFEDLKDNNVDVEKGEVIAQESRELPAVQLRPVDSTNWKCLVDMSIPAEQEEFVAENWYALLEWKFAENPDNIRPFCVYGGEVPVGFITYALDRDMHRWVITRLMVDAKHQGMGYGKASLISLFDIVRDTLGNIAFYTYVDPQNEAALRLCEGVGLLKTGEELWNEEVMRIML
ncbi:MAG: GNAT family N-acetyltransferase [Defluviitaleaceae bacterium]|nr:GNAT family N-acetyltransferase [Defluviitaleaceae bacterium]